LKDDVCSNQVTVPKKKLFPGEKEFICIGQNKRDVPPFRDTVDCKERKAAGFTGMPRSNQGCQIFLGTMHQSGEKYTKLPKNYQNAHKICTVVVKYSK
jgi:hypothetical protein